MFDDGKAKGEQKVDLDRLHAKIGQLALENDSPEPQAGGEPTGEDLGDLPIDGVVPSSGAL